MGNTNTAEQTYITNGRSNHHSAIEETDEDLSASATKDFTLRSVVTESHNKDALGRPVLSFDKWEVYNNDFQAKSHDRRTNGAFIPTATINPLTINDNSDIESSSSYEELAKCNSMDPALEIQTHSNSSDQMQINRPTSLAIFSISHDSGYRSIYREVDTSSQSLAAVSHYNNDFERDKAKSAETLLDDKPRTVTTGLQQRRNRRPTSLMIPSLMTLQQPAQTAAPAINTQFTFNSEQPTLSIPPPPPSRQRSHSMPSSSLLQMKPDKKSHGYTVEEAINLVNKKKISKTEINEHNLLHKAAEAGHVKLLKKCISNGCDLTQPLDSLLGLTALHCAARADKKSAEVMKLLLAAGVDVDAKNRLGETALFSAIIYQNMDSVHLLIDQGANVNTVWQNSTPLHLILSTARADVARKLIMRGAHLTTQPRGAKQHPLHAVLELCHTKPIDYKMLNLLEMVFQADGNAVDHLEGYRRNKPGQAQQELIYHIYSMDRGPIKEKGKKIILNLIKLGYSPQRCELTTMSESDANYDYMYMYVKSGVPPLRDLCVRSIRQHCIPNVSYSVENWRGRPIGETEKNQILLQPQPLPEHDYENVEIREKQKDYRKSKRKSLKSFMDGIGLSRFSQKHKSKRHNDDDMAIDVKATKTLISIPKNGLRREKSGSLPLGIDQAHQSAGGKGLFTKRKHSRKDSSLTVADIVRRYSTHSEHSLSKHSSSEHINLEVNHNSTEDISHKQVDICFADNQGYRTDSEPLISARIEVNDDESERGVTTDNDVTIKFHAEDTVTIKPVEDHVQTPSSITNPLTSGSLSTAKAFSTQIEIGDNY